MTKFEKIEKFVETHQSEYATLRDLSKAIEQKFPSTAVHYESASPFAPERVGRFTDGLQIWNTRRVQGDVKWVSPLGWINLHPFTK